MHQYPARNWHKRLHEHQEQGSASPLGKENEDKKDQGPHNKMQQARANRIFHDMEYKTLGGLELGRLPETITCSFSY